MDQLLSDPPLTKYTHSINKHQEQNFVNFESQCLHYYFTIPLHWTHKLSSKFGCDTLTKLYFTSIFINSLYFIHLSCNIMDFISTCKDKITNRGYRKLLYIYSLSESIYFSLKLYIDSHANYVYYKAFSLIPSSW